MAFFEDCKSGRNSWLTEHAAIRAQQRGILPDALELLRQYGDINVPAALRRMCCSLSRRVAQELLVEGYSAKLVESAQKFQLIMDENGLVITVLAAHSDRRKRPHARSARRGTRVAQRRE